MKIYTEFAGTFLFLFTIALAAAGGSPLAPLAIGGMLVAMVFMGGHRSGAHYNPAVSLGALLQGKMGAGEFVGYVIAQVVAGLLAFWAGYVATGRSVPVVPSSGATLGQALIVEFVFTLALVLVVLNVAASRRTEGNSYYGLAIGITIMAAAFAGGPISGGSFNPAVGIGGNVVHAIVTGNAPPLMWVSILAPLVGGALGSYIWASQESADERGAPRMPEVRREGVQPGD